jgi:hypothetical protein
MDSFEGSFSDARLFVGSPSKLKHVQHLQILRVEIVNPVVITYAGGKILFREGTYGGSESASCWGCRVVTLMAFAGDFRWRDVSAASH